MVKIMINRQHKINSKFDGNKQHTFGTVNCIYTRKTVLGRGLRSDRLHYHAHTS